MADTQSETRDNAHYFLLTVDVEDWFQVENFKSCIPYSSWPSRELRVERNTHRILDLFDSASCKILIPISALPFLCWAGLPTAYPAWSVKSNNALYLQISVLTAALLALYFPFIGTPVHDWNVNEDFSHSYLIPPIAAFMLWQRRSELKNLDFTPNNLGLVLIIIGLIQLIIAKIGSEYFLQRTSLIIVLFGVSLLSDAQQCRSGVFTREVSDISFERICNRLLCLLSDLKLFICRDYQDFNLTVLRTDFTDSTSGQLIPFEIDLHTESVQAPGATLANVW